MALHCVLYFYFYIEIIVVTVHVNFPNQAAYFALTPVIKMPFLEENGNLSNKIFNYLGIPPNTELSITVQKILEFVTPYYNPRSMPYQPSARTKMQPFENDIKMTLQPNSQQIDINDCLIPYVCNI